MAAAVSNSQHQPWRVAVATGASRFSTGRCPVVVASAPVCARGCRTAGGVVLLPSWASRRTSSPRRHAVAAAKAGAASSLTDAVAYSARISTDMPLYEPPGVSFDEYLMDRARVFRAMFPDESRCQRLSDEEWRVRMLPLQFLLLTVHPVVVMQLRHRAGVLELRITEWELRGLERGYAPASFNLGVLGSLYADRSRGRRACRLKGHLEIGISCVLPPPMRLVPEAVLRGVAESVLRSLAERMKRDVDVGLIADFQRFRREKAAAAAATGKLNAGADRVA
ncbi:hypothetical protein GUJ93_ZPchr0013g34075 [Zizania palustris]|uniref:DUF1997 family protein n=1 Tax=Zizania palustris TaxID=103762 RepID=A0A8J5X0P2_ZIZPA|nr:hypothetical protein GUJ93_ZPchr0013g34075 [Zizania palustris]